MSWITTDGYRKATRGCRWRTTSILQLKSDQALSGNIPANDIDLIIVATTTPDRTFPATATKVQADLGITSGAAFDIQAVCAGFVYALSAVIICCGQGNHVEL